MRPNARLMALGAVSAIALLAGPAQAELSAQDAARLGKDLTPVGAEAAGNKDGSIPAWTGGLPPTPAGQDPGNPYAGDKPLYTVTAANFAQYKDKLAPGQIAMLQRYPTYRMNVYPTRRSAGLPASEYEIVKREGMVAQLADGGNGVLNVDLGSVPFPVPKTGVEPIWNHMMRYRGGTFIRYGTEFPVHTNGSFTPVRRTEWYARSSALGSPEPNRMSYYKNIVTAPSSIAGEAILTHDPLDQVKEARLAWTYNPGQRRVLRAPSVSYDSPGTGTDGLRTMDDYDGFNGAPDRFDWKLVGKKEMIIPYNNFRLGDRALKYKDIIKEGHIDQELVRYELHRVWVVQATVKSGVRHLYSKRDFYIDEDSWSIAHKDQYDGRGELWRIHELFLRPEPAEQIMHYAGNAMYDLQARRYIVHSMNNEEKPAKYGLKYELSQFSPDSLRRIGN
ncbi:DUF1329 domain-containing protein [Azospirillum agricola]|uniref:DUF1329 domain-containing protein n=1 Tax=Azospirillum agricola TaxID=1720247 RepID=UPI000A0F3AFE|nr:DUF1329 domain-containing protein [Azospirillum agricola]SMH62801.1 Protein of unknown function [Azospirillum lipoferum]